MKKQLYFISEYSKRMSILVLFMTLLFCKNAQAQTTLWTESFDATPWTTSQYGPTWTTGIGSWFMTVTPTGQTGWSTSTTSPRSPTKQMLAGQAGNNSATYLMTPGQSLTANSKYTFNYWMRTYASAGTDNFTVKVIVGTVQTTAGMLAGTTLATFTSPGQITGTYQQFSGSYTPTTSGTYYFCLYALRNSGFYVYADDVSFVKVCDAPTGSGSITGPNSVCSGATNKTYSISGLTGATAYSWTVPSGASLVDANNTSSTTMTVNWGSTGGAVTCYATSGSGACVAPGVTYNVTVNPTPATPIISVYDDCTVSTLTITNPLGGATFAWTGGGSDNPHDVFTSGTYGVTQTSTLGCTSALGVANANPPSGVPTPVVVSTPGTYCFSTTLTATSSGGVIYWQGTTSGGIDKTVQTSSKVVIASGTYYFRAWNTCGWGDEGSVAVVINPLPGAVTVNGGGTYCQTANLTASGGTGGTIYWQETTSLGTSTADTISSKDVTSSGTYYFRAQTALGCWGPEGSQAVTIIPDVPSAVSVSGGVTQCGGTETVLASGGSGGIIYYQGTNAGGTSTSTQSTSEVVSASGTYYFNANNVCGWGTEGSTVVTINTVPDPVIVFSSGTYCQSTSISAGGGANGTIYYQGTQSGGTSTILGGTPQTITTSGTYYFRSLSPLGCWGPQSSVVIVIEQPVTQVSTPSPANATTNLVVTAGNLTWTAGTGATSQKKYFGTDNPPTNIVNGTNGSSPHAYSTLAYGKKYYWRIDGVNSCGTTTGPTWSFTTTYDQTYTSTGSWTCPAGVTSILVRAWGGGGAGGGATTSANAGGGGGGGGYASKVVPVTPTVTYSVAVGATVAGSTGSGANGNPSWFGSTSTVYADYGRGGSNGTNGAGGVGGTANIGDTTNNGGGGFAGVGSGSGGGGGGGAGSDDDGASATSLTGALGGAGSGGNGGNGTSGANGNTGNPFGGGGGGARRTSSTNRSGGAGARGNVIITIIPCTTPAKPVVSVINNCGNSVLTITNPETNSTYSWSDGGTNNPHTVTSAGTYTVTQSVSDGECTSLAENVVADPIIVPDIVTVNPVDPIQCGGSVTLTASGGGGGTIYYQGTGSGGTSTGDNSITVNIGSSGTYYFRSYNNGCWGDEGSSQVTIHPVPDAVSVSGDGTIQCGGSVTLTASGGSGGTIYFQGTNRDGTSTATASSTESVSSTGTYYFRSFNGDCWGDQDSAAVTIHTAVTLSHTQLNNDCHGNSIGSIDLTVLTGTPAYSYDWSNTESTEDITGLSAGTYLVTVTDDNNCSASSLITITGPDLLTIEADYQLYACDGSDLFLTSSTAGGTGPFTYTWDGPNGSLNIDNPNPTIPTVDYYYDSGDYMVSVTDQNGCVAGPAHTEVNVHLRPTGSLSVYLSSTVCEGHSILIDAFVDGEPLSIMNGVINDSIIFTGSPGDIYPTVWPSPPSTDYLITSLSNQFCASAPSDLNNSGAVTITTVASPTVSINTPTTTVLTCDDPTIHLTTTASSGVTYSWSQAGETTDNIDVTAPGTYTVTVTAGNACSWTDEIIITQNIAVTAGITNNTATTVLGCTTASISLTATGGVSYEWSTTETTDNISVSTPDTYSVTVTAANGCTDVASVVITQSTATPTAGIVNNTVTTILTCSTPSISLTATGGATYEWSTTETTDNISVSAPGTYSVTVTAANGCTDVTSIAITQDVATPTAGIVNNTATTVLTCTTPFISLTATGGVSYLWSTTDATDNISVSAPGTYSVTVTAANGCTDVTSIEITQDIAVTAGITNNTATTVLTCTTPSINLTATGGASYQWSTTESTDNITVGSADNYSVTVTAANGCTDVTSIIITQDIAVTAGITNNTATTVLTCTTPAISLTATGGASYQWSTSEATDNISVVSPGTYSVTVTAANGCTDVTSIEITQDIAVTAGITNNTATTVLTCTTPSISLTATGGVSYLWSTTDATDNISVSAPGTYSVTVTAANGCTDVTSIIITQDIAVTAGITNNTATTVLTCTAPAISLTATGGVSYLWSTTEATDNIVVGSPDTYSVTVTAANGCTDVASVVITQNIAVTAGITNNTATTVLTCATTSISLTATGGVSYEWSTTETTDNISVTTPDTYSVTVTAINGCTDVTSVVITQDIATPTATITPGGATTFCNGGNVNLDAGAGFASYLWSNNATTQVINVTASGTYSVTVSGANGCTATSSATTVTVNICTTNLDMNMYIQGYYIGSGYMQPVMENQFVFGAASDETDTVFVTLRDENDPFTIIATQWAILKTDGTVHVEFTGSYPDNYWISVTHRNALETWSSVAVSLSSGYDFTDAANKALYDNQIEVEPGVWAFYSGDLIQDGFIGVDDVNLANNDNLDGLLFDYYATDINGDGFVGVDDVNITNNNNLNGIFFLP